MTARTPKSRAAVSGALARNPARFANRTEPKGLGPIGDPYPKMTDGQKAVWRELAITLPWLKRSHRLIVRATCVLAARMDDDGGLGVAATRALSSLLSKLGATPVDESRLNFGEPPEPDPADRFFTRAN